MENRNSYTAVGLFFIAFVACFAIFMWFMSDSDKNVDYTNYYIITNELPTGIRVESQVKFVGVVVGSVSDIAFNSDEKIRLTLKIREDIPIKADSVADIDYQMISGISSLNISRGTKNFGTNPKIITLNEGLLTKLKNNAQTMGEKLNESLLKLDKLTSDENILHLQNTLKGIDELTSGVAKSENLENLSEILKNLSNFSASLNELNLKEINANLSSITKSANALFTGLNKTQLLLADKIKSGEYDLKQTIEPTLDEANKFLNSFEKTLKELRNALNRLEDNPYEFFFKDTSGDTK
ncbi:MlaD family protein [Campylobacter mucosalis]|uniref:Lipid asymmetry ABC transporter MlaABCDEF, periplasmic component MlaD n=1 Tax=Campylobacter mucosalis CCUG 21559 TaxID=1032067 RepID=A0A6G5QHD6_9BACT|nr:MlaD family protein [Campylobacter mucosalis]QCD45034.1 lipid asymmetry ABC transporter MlaABCDEF, periplasmic component MlaD [Campylobacter mucosalis CCUG 21559]